MLKRTRSGVSHVQTVRRLFLDPVSLGLSVGSVLAFPHIAELLPSLADCACCNGFSLHFMLAAWCFNNADDETDAVLHAGPRMTCSQLALKSPI